MRERCVAESRMIKSKLIYKLDHELDLTPLEKEYLRRWRREMERNTTLIDDCFVPSTPSSLKIENLSKEDIARFNKLPKV